MNPGVSIIICCYNSRKVISDTLKYIASLDRGDFAIEILLVDNASTDETMEFASQVWNSFRIDLPLRIIVETKQGLTYARQTGIRAAIYDLILFCDDDNWLQPNYVRVAFGFMAEHLDVGCLGGLNEGVLESVEPEWWIEKSRGYAVGRQAEKSGDISERGYVYGAGMVVRKIILDRFFNSGFEPLLSDRKGQNLSSGGDSEICKWALLMGYKLWYLDELCLKHFITKARLTDQYVEQLYDGHDKAYMILKWYDMFIENLNVYYENRPVKNLAIYFLRRLKTNVSESYRAQMQLRIGNLRRIHPILFRIIKMHRSIVGNSHKNLIDNIQ